MKQHGISLKGYRLTKDGKLVPDKKGMSVSKKIQQRKSKKVTVKRGAP
jgi:hypothetical protein